MKHIGIVLCPILLASGFAHGAAVAHHEFNGTGTANVGSTILDSTGNPHGSVAGMLTLRRRYPA